MMLALVCARNVRPALFMLGAAGCTHARWQKTFGLLFDLIDAQGRGVSFSARRSVPRFAGSGYIELCVSGLAWQKLYNLYYVKYNFKLLRPGLCA